MTKTRIVGSSGRYGVRYGVSVRRKISDIEKKQRRKQQCIFCKGQEKRSSKGIWECKKCGKIFAGHAYFLEQEVYQEQPETKSLNKEKTIENSKSTKKSKKTE